jgi:rubrerythrin
MTPKETIQRFEDAVMDWAFAGSKMPEERPEIEREYLDAKDALTALKDTAEPDVIRIAEDLVKAGRQVNSLLERIAKALESQIDDGEHHRLCNCINCQDERRAFQAERFSNKGRTCPECRSRGFKPSITGNGCTFCDGTEGGNPPSSGSYNDPVEAKRYVYCDQCGRQESVDGRCPICDDGGHL